MNDPRITAYALGELDGPGREEFEHEMASSDALQDEVARTGELVRALGDLPAPAETLEPTRRMELLAQCAHNLAMARRRRMIRLAVPMAIAAVVCVLAVPVLVRESATPPELAESTRREAKDEVAAATPDARLALARADQDRLAEEIRRQVQSQTRLSASASSTPAEATAAMAAVVGPPNITMGPPPAVAQPQSVTSGAVTLASADSALGFTDSKTKEFASGWGKGVASGTGARGRASVGAEGDLAPAQPADFNTEAYDAIEENAFKRVTDHPLSTFSIDLDTASYANVRRFLMSDQLPPAGAIRTEELINYFPYAYPAPKGDAPFSVSLDVATAPWNPARQLVLVGLKGRELDASARPPANLVFLVDVSGSMDEPNKLPLLQRSLRALVENLRPEDRVAMVSYAGSSGLVLPSTPASRRAEILAAIDNLKAGGSTHGSSGITLAYEVARENFLKEGANRVILCTDGDFNVGVTNQSELQKLIERERETGVYLSVLGFGIGNLKDATMEMLANKGNGNHAYIDSLQEARRVLVEQMGGTLFTIAKDVKIQVEFNPARVAAYRLIGYENRLLAKEDFNDDRKDAGEIGAGHTVTALYEIVPAGQAVPGSPSVDPLKYKAPAPMDCLSDNPNQGELLTVKLRYKAPDGDQSRLLEFPLAAPEVGAFDKASDDFRFAVAVAAFGMKLRGSPEAGDLSWDDILRIARGALGSDPGSRRAEFLTLVERARVLAP